MSHVNVHHRVISAEKDFNEQVDKMKITLSVDMSQDLSPATLSSRNWLMNKMAMVAGKDVMHGLSNIDLYSPRLTGYAHF